MRISSAILLSGLAAQQVAATWDLYAPKFKSPQTNDNECSDKQKGGYDWNDLPDGPAKGYDNFNFGGGWSCAKSFGKRDHLTKRTFNSKCVKNTVQREKPASFDCGDKLKKGFSVKEFQVSVEYDAHLEFHYEMDDGSTCKQTAPCKKEGTIVKNTQCGGAKKVHVYLGKHEQNKGKESCEIGFHHIDFDCNPPKTRTTTPVTSTTPPASSSSTPATTTKPTESKPVESKPSESKPTESKPSDTKPVESTPSPTQPTESKPVESKPVESTPVVTPPTYGTLPASSKPYLNTTAPATSQPVESTPVESTPVESKPVESKPVESTPVESKPVESTPIESKPAESTPAESTPVVTPPVESSTTQELTTSTIFTTSTLTTTSCAEVVTDCPADKASTVIVTSVIAVSTTVCPVSSPSAPSSAPSSATTSPSSPPAGGAGAPPVLPKCLNTWLEIDSECGDNSDYACYCKKVDFTKDVIDCVTAWGSDEEVQSALSYLAGICAQFIPQNPGIITNCPSTVTLAPPTPVATTGGPSKTGEAPVTPPVAVPVTTIEYKTTITVPCSTSGSVIPGSSTVTTISTAVTVPQVVFEKPSTTAPGVTAVPVNLVPGTPPPVPVVPTTAAGVTPPANPAFPTSTFAVVPTGNGTASAPPALFTGAASTMSFKSAAPALLGALLAFFAL